MRNRFVLMFAMAVLVFGSTSSASAGVASFQGLGDFSGGDFESQAYDVSADGLVVVGFGTTASGREAFRWENGTMTGLGAPTTAAFGVSADGSVIVGHIGPWYDENEEAFRWENGTVTRLGGVPSCAFGVSADGSVVVGRAYSDWLHEAFRWENGVMMRLGLLCWISCARGVSADGSVVVGECPMPPPRRVPLGERYSDVSNRH